MPGQSPMQQSLLYIQNEKAHTVSGLFLLLTALSDQSCWIPHLAERNSKDRSVLVCRCRSRQSGGQIKRTENPRGLLSLHKVEKKGKLVMALRQVLERYHSLLWTGL